MDSVRARAGTIAVLGLGAMGYGMAASLRRGGFAVAGFDMRPDVTRRFAEETAARLRHRRARRSRPPTAVVVVVNADQTEAVLFGAERRGARHEARRGDPVLRHHGAGAGPRARGGGRGEGLGLSRLSDQRRRAARRRTAR